MTWKPFLPRWPLWRGFTDQWCIPLPLRWRHNGQDSVSNHQPYDCLLNRLFRRRWKKTSKLRVTGLCAGSSPRTGGFPAQMGSNTENVAISWHHHEGPVIQNFMFSLLLTFKNCSTNTRIVAESKRDDAVSTLQYYEILCKRYLMTF